MKKQLVPVEREPETTERQQRVDRQADDVLRFYDKLVGKIPANHACDLTVAWVGTWKSKTPENPGKVVGD